MGKAVGEALGAANEALDEAAARVPDLPADRLAEISGLDPATAEFLAKASGGPIGEVWAMLGAEVRYKRLKQAVRIAERAAAFMQGREARRVKLNTLVPLLEAGSLNEDEGMAERWAALLAHAADPGEEEVPPSFPAILQQMSPDEARLLDALEQRSSFDTVELAKQLGVRDWSVAFDNLVRQRLAVHPFRPGPVASEDMGNLRVTALGSALVRGCRPPGSMSNG